MRRLIITAIAVVCAAATTVVPFRTEAASTIGGCLAGQASCIQSIRGVQPSAVPMCTPARPHASGTTVEAVTTVNGLRNYRLHVPTSYTGSDVLPLVFDIHGANSNGTEQEVYSAFSTKADAQGFVVVYPEGVSAHFNAWQLPSPQPDDVAFMKAALDAVETQLCIDQSRVYSTGISNGAMMSIRLACSLSARIAAIAPVAGAYYPPDALNLNPAETCPDAAPMPMLALHGTADTFVPFNGGVGTGTAGLNFRLPVDDSTPAEDVMSDWSMHDGCAGSRSESTVSSEVRFIEYGACADGAQVQLYAVDGGGHTWPGSFDVPSLGYTTHQINATDLIWSFFAAHSKADADADSVPDGLDNCPADFNPNQVITRRGVIDLHPFGKLFDDTTFLNATALGDGCNPDIDGDGFGNGVEIELGPGGASRALCPAASANTDPIKLDSDGDGFMDRAECMLGFDPVDAMSKPPVFYASGDSDGDMLPDALELALGTDANKTDTDTDKLNDGVEFLYYGSDPTDSNTDADICDDGREAASLNNDTKVNSTDQLIVAQSFGPIGGPKYVADFDVNKDRNINSTDMLVQAKNYGTC